MNIFSNIVQTIDDAISPIVIKELRQAVQGRFVTGILYLFLFLQMAVISISLIGKTTTSDFQRGNETFMFLFGILLGASIVAIPLYTGSRFSSERSESETDLLFITTITPGSIVSGKFLAAMALVALFYSAGLPFMTLTYMLRGIDLPSIFLSLAFSLFPVAFSILLAIFLSSLPLGQALRTVIGIFGIIFLLYLWMGSIAFFEHQIRTGIGSRLFSGNFWGECIPLSIFFIFFHGLFYVVSVASITPPMANRALGIRVYLTLAWLISLIIFSGYCVSFRSYQAIVAWMGMSLFIISLSFLASVSERDAIGPRVARSVPEGGFRRFFAFLLFSGAGGGVSWGVILCLLTFISGSFVLTSLKGYFSYSYGSVEKDLGVFLGMSLYCFSYALSANFIRNFFFHEKIDRHFTWFLAIALGGVMGAFPYIFGNILFQTDDEILLVANPFILGSYKSRDEAMVFVSAWSIFMALISFGWVQRQWANFHPPYSGPQNGNPALKALGPSNSEDDEADDS